MNRSILNRILLRYKNVNNARTIRKIASSVRSTVQLNEAVAPVVFFNASTRLGGVSLNAAYGFLGSCGVELAGVPVVHFACQAGMTRCPLGTNPDDHLKRPPCQICIKQSQSLSANAPTRWFDYTESHQLTQVLESKS